MTSYRLLFDARVRIHATVAATNAREAHFTAYCDTAGALHNDQAITGRLAALGIKLEVIRPLELLDCKPVNERNSNA